MFVLLLLAQLEPAEAFKKMAPAEDLSVRLFAAEPMLINPTCFDIDARGRLWVCEGVNYRGSAGPRNSKPPYFPAPNRKTGDRIVILEDSDGDGAADRSTVFYEGLDLQSPLGIAVIGEKLWVSQAPDIFTFEIKPDGTAGKKETVLTGFGGLNHDHGVHSVYVGPDAKLYGCFGNEGARVTFPDGRKVFTDGKPYRGGCAWRSNRDLSGLEILGHNYRNNYECATDSFGTTFMSDNDDDGNQQVRFTYTMEGGDFGYAGFSGGTHWHMEQPGVVPILMRTGAGSPTGLCHYEGTLLPERFRGQPIHVDAGPGVVWSYILKPDGAGFIVEGSSSPQTIETLYQIRQPPVLLKSADRWFRPSDVAVAPDGSLFVSDWYDPGVGGHGMGDSTRGRIYRILPRDHDGSYRVTPSDDLMTNLASPCLATRTLAILKAGPAAIPALAAAKERILRARALFLLGTLGAQGQKHVRAALADPDPDFRILAIRSLRQNGADMVEATRPLLRDPSAAVRREILLALRFADPSAGGDALIALASQYDGQDRWYLEAINIAFRGREETLVPPLLESLKGKWDKRTAGLMWIFRRPDALPMILEVLSDAARPLAEREAALEALESINDPKAGEAVLRAASGPTAAKALEILARKVPGSWKHLASRPELAAVLERALLDPKLAAAARPLAALLGTRPLTRWRISPTFPNAGDSGFDKVYPPEEAEEPEKLEGWTEPKLEADGSVDLNKNRGAKSWVVVYAATVLFAREAVDARLWLGSDDGVKVWVNGRKVHANHPHTALAARRDQVKIKLNAGVNRILLKVDQGDGGWGFISELEAPPRDVWEITGREAPLPLPPAAERLDPRKLPPNAELLNVAGDAARGRELFFRSLASCAKCHKVKGEGGEIAGIGPELSVIGTKGGKDMLLDSIVRPSAAVAPEYSRWVVTTNEDLSYAGIIVEETAEKLVLKDNDGFRFEVPVKAIKERKKGGVSPMPEDLVGALSRQQLADLLEYLAQLK